MFSRKKVDSIDTKQVILDAAARLFAEKGFEAVSIRELSKEANVNIAMIAYHFGSKEGLFKAIVTDRIPSTTAQLKNIESMSISHWEKISMTIDLYIDKIFNEHGYNKLIFRELSLEQRPEHRELILKGIEANWLIIRSFIEDGQNKGFFKSEIDPAMTVITLFSTMSMLVNTACLGVKILNEKDETMIFSEATKLRVKTHLKLLIKSHLFVNS